jgi:hypothetical protein
VLTFSHGEARDARADRKLREDAHFEIRGCESARESVPPAG